MKSDQERNIIAREIWAYQECPWDFDNPPEGMAQLQKQMAIDQAERIRTALDLNRRSIGKRLAQFVMAGQRIR